MRMTGFVKQDEPTDGLSAHVFKRQAERFSHGAYGAFARASEICKTLCFSACKTNENFISFRFRNTESPPSNASSSTNSNRTFAKMGYTRFSQANSTGSRSQTVSRFRGVSLYRC